MSSLPSSASTSTAFDSRLDEETRNLSTEAHDPPSSNVLPFLVTNWLANYEGADGRGELDDRRKEAVDRIRRATSDIAAAFSSLGAFGQSTLPSFAATSSDLQSNPLRNLTFADMRRQWNGVSPNQIEYMAQAIAYANRTADTVASDSQRTNLIHAASESRDANQSNANGGRSLQDAINVDIGLSDAEDAATGLAFSDSILQAPVLLTKSTMDTTLPVNGNLPTNRSPMVRLQSTYANIAHRTAQAMRSFLELREQVQKKQLEINGLNMSISKQEAIVDDLIKQYDQISQGADMTKMLQISDDVKAGKQDCERVTAQLRRKLSDLTNSLQTEIQELEQLGKTASSLELRRRSFVKNFRDPFLLWTGPLAPGHRLGGNAMFQTIVRRQHGISAPRNQLHSIRTPTFGSLEKSNFVATRKALLSTRLSHAATINTHLSYPVYCLRFDKTGRYFITGADDYLVKLFFLGGGLSCRNKSDIDGSRLPRCNYGANVRGAIHVLSLRGHAGVINDIDVSSDNAFLATASVDGDVRVWGLKDGCPVAILRGHKGGANMVSWSKLTPYRLVTAGADGFARVWDIREACLKRYGALVGNRPEYTLKLSDKERATLSQGRQRTAERRKDDSPSPLLAPGNPYGGSTTDTPLTNTGANSNEVVVPPLPPAVPPLPGGAGMGNIPGINQPEQIAPPGQFVANDEIDEGVRLLSKFKHGSTVPEVPGPSTRSRRATVNVICVARCPTGGHFTTGSDDGICRVFADFEESGVAIVDRRNVGHGIIESHSSLQEGKRNADEPLLKLMGHVSAITDLAYSHAGDRLLSASQKDGVVRLWLLGTRVIDGSTGEGGVSQIVIKLTDPRASTSRTQSQTSRRGPGSVARAETSKVSCDVAVWTHDDARIVTSQSVLVKQSGSDIQPGSQYLFLWDSRTGQCLMGIAGAHTMQCPVVIPHPKDSSLICTAAADGFAKVWDWETGQCIFTHRNVVEFGPIEPSEHGKLAGYLDGSFHSDGTGLVLTDDSGRLTILDSAMGQGEPDRSSLAWMKEQYFANDYYEMFYDRSGYCIERGSERPPHLAPRGVRCNHTGSPVSDEVNEAFAKLVGPSPLSIQVCRWRREVIRRKSHAALMSKENIGQGTTVKVRRGVREYDPSSTIVINASGCLDESQMKAKPSQEIPGQDVPRGQGRPRGGSAQESAPRALSANWRYLDYDDMMREQGNQDEELDSDDEEFNPTASRNQGTVENSDESDEEMDFDEIESESPLRRNRASRQRVAVSEGRPLRSQRRSQRSDSQFVELDSDDEMVAQYMSTNNTPSGPYVEDYTTVGHFWRMPSGTVRRKWLCRHESDTSYEGRKIYAPQLGDSVVYIPRAHYETVSHFPSLEKPWQRWPQGAAWPVVRCCVRGVRYRFPYEDYYRASQSMCNSIVAILTLEVTGIPEISGDREFPWPKPSFVESTRAFVFELSVFEHDKSDFIFPEGVYMARLRALEAALRERNGVEGLPVSVYYNTSGTEDEAMESYQGHIARLQEEDSPSSAHLVGSGFGVISVAISNYEDEFSPWDICMPNLAISRPHLSDDEKKLVLESLNIQCRKESVAEHLNLPVDSNRYSDYNRMVEIEMHLMGVKRRLRCDYYASKLSVVGDLRLIRDNCIKYNGVANDLVRVATVMCEDFEAMVLSEEERAFLISEEEFRRLSQSSQTLLETNAQAPTVRLRLQQRTNQVATHSHQPNVDEVQLSRGRSGGSSRMQRRSSLENLPDSGPVPPRRRGLRSDSQAGGRQHSRATNTTASASSGSQRLLRSQGPAPNLESLSRLNNGSSVADNDTSESGTRNRQLSGRNSSQGTGLYHNEAEGESESLGAVARALPRNGRTTVENASGERNTHSRRQGVHRSTRSAQSSVPASDVEMNERELRQRRRAASSHRTEQSESSEQEQEDSSEGIRANEVVPRVTRQPLRATSGTRGTSSRTKGAARPLPDETSLDSSDHMSANDSDEEEESETSENGAKQVRKTRSSARSTRASARASSTNVEDDPSDFEPDDDSSDESEDEAPRNRVRKVKSYAELSSDAYSEDDYAEEWEKPNRSKATSKKRSASRNRASQPGKRKKANAPDEEHITPWPEIPMKSITPVCKAMLTRMSKEKSAHWFKRPVLDDYPELADSYLKVVTEPMDLRTIQEERVHLYQHIKELQDDLLLIFRNCINFNGVDDAVGKDAMKMIKKLNEMFAEVCRDKNVTLPRRWKP